MTQILENSTVAIHYEVKDPGGDTIDSSFGQDPLQFTMGRGELIEGLEKKLLGKKVGEKFEALVVADEAYGSYRDDLVSEVEKSQFQDASALAVGQQFSVESEVGEMLLTITEIKENSVIVDGNHPQAGKDLTFNVEVISVE